MQWWSDFKAGASKKLSQFNNSTFKNGAMATAALITAADGSVDKSEVSKVAGFIGSCDWLQAFDAADLKKQFEAYCGDAGDEFRRINLLQLVRKLKGNEAQADTAIRMAIVIANADGDFAEAEKKVVRELCGVLGLAADTYLA